jgi:hypothetical protein
VNGEVGVKNDVKGRTLLEMSGKPVNQGLAKIFWLAQSAQAHRILSIGQNDRIATNAALYSDLCLGQISFRQREGPAQLRGLSRVVPMGPRFTQSQRVVRVIPIESPNSNLLHSECYYLDARFFSQMHEKSKVQLAASEPHSHFVPQYQIAQEYRLRDGHSPETGLF